MSDKDNGRMAFPMYFAGDIQPQGGMTLRDYFAAKTLAKIAPTFAELGELTSQGCEAQGIIDAITMLSYKIADCMLAERDK